MAADEISLPVTDAVDEGGVVLSSEQPESQSLLPNIEGHQGDDGGLLLLALVTADQGVFLLGQQERVFLFLRLEKGLASGRLGKSR